MICRYNHNLNKLKCDVHTFNCWVATCNFPYYIFFLKCKFVDRLISASSKLKTTSPNFWMFAFKRKSYTHTYSQHRLYRTNEAAPGFSQTQHEHCLLFPFSFCIAPFIIAASASSFNRFFPSVRRQKRNNQLLISRMQRKKERSGMMEGERAGGCSAPSTEQRWLNWVTETLFQRSSNAHQAHSNSLQPLRNDWGAETRAGSQARFGGTWTSCIHPWGLFIC